MKGRNLKAQPSRGTERRRDDEQTMTRNTGIVAIINKYNRTATEPAQKGQ